MNYGYEEKDIKADLTKSKKKNERPDKLTFTKQKLEESTYSTKIYTAIKDIVLRSFYPAPDMDIDDMMAFVNSLLV